MNEIILTISGLVSVIALIVFFVMASNVSTIKDYIKVAGKTDLYSEYKKRDTMKRPANEILYAAQDFVWSELVKDKTINRYEELKKGWAAKFESLGGEFPDYPFTKV
ncbi:hypothetical protein [Pedobacter sp. Leaf132]|uniref:hypothetical protein n=1 Tax=Pedobacter sp. Leaf132 TaxID=2876557 RepID=UPI001E61F0BA|nr:hypothetical protein [Pedobacter sp. Leaf132]